MQLITWTDQYSVHISEIDAQHKRLIECINKLHDAMMNGHSVEIMVELIDDLRDYTDEHFAKEEAFMRQYGYPGYTEHHSEHRFFCNTVEDLHNRYRSGEVFLYLETMQFLSDWLSKHILGTDQRYVPFLREKGVTENS